MKGTKGITLIEMLFALTMTMLILSMTTFIYLTAQHNFQFQSALSQIQENARMVITLLRSDLRYAGYMGCAKLTDDFPIKNATTYLFDNKHKLLLDQNSVTVRHANLQHANLTRNMRGHTILHATRNPDFIDGEILLISDCNKAEIFRAKKVVTSKIEQTITAKQPLSNRFDQAAEISGFEENTFFIDKTSRQTPIGTPLYALYKKDINNNKMELVEGVERMKIQMTPGDAGLAIEFLLSSFIGFSKTSISKVWYTYVAFTT